MKMFEDNIYVNPQALMGGYSGMSNWGNGSNLGLNLAGYTPSALLTDALPGAGISGIGLGGTAGNASNGGFLGGMIGTKETPGWGGLALGGASALLSGIMGFKQLGLAKKSLAENKRQFNLNFDAQRRTTNSMLEDRQRARVASNPGAYQSVGDYMNQNGVRG